MEGSPAVWPLVYSQLALLMFGGELMLNEEK